MKVVHVITGLEGAGAELNLYRLIKATTPAGYSHEVISLTGEGPVHALLTEFGVPVSVISMRRTSFSAIGAIGKVAHLVRQARPDIVQTWMYHADLVGGLAARITRTPVVWGIQASELDPATDRTSRAVASLNAWLSRTIPRSIVSNSEAGRQWHARFGYDSRKFVVIPTGFEVPAWPTEQTRAASRRQFGIPRECLVVGRIGRFAPVKDIRSFVMAAQIVVRKVPDVVFVLCGGGLDPSNSMLQSWIGGAGLTERFFLLGPMTNLEKVYPVLDVFCSSSYAEGFPGVVGEAMSYAIPVVATDAGDSAALVGNCGRIVPARNPTSLGAALVEILLLRDPERSALGAAARSRISDYFSLESMGAKYDAVYRKILQS